MTTACGKATSALTTLNGSGSGSGSNTTTGETTTGETTTGEAVVPVNKSIRLNDTAGAAVAYVISVNENAFSIYIPSTELYTAVNVDGTYSSNYLYYFSGTNCTGSLRSSGWQGVTGSTVQYVNNAYYKVTGSQTTPFAYQSYIIGTTCTNASANTSGIIGVVSVTTQPYDFTTLAPLTPVFE